MKINKEKMKQELLEGLLELVLTLACLGIGIFVVSLLGFDWKVQESEFDFLILIGCAVFLAIFAIVYFLARLVKKIIKSKNSRKM